MPAVSQLETDKFYKSYSLREQIPEGIMFVNFVEDTEGKLVHVSINLGKAGSTMAAWVESVADLINSGLARDMKVEDFVVLFSGITSDRGIKDANGKTTRSGPEGLFNLFMQYRRIKFVELQNKLGLTDSMPLSNDPDD